MESPMVYYSALDLVAYFNNILVYEYMNFKFSPVSSTSNYI